ncbi:MAG: hypothetical protein U0166_22215 [Acidobacteriota bacterium]
MATNVYSVLWELFASLPLVLLALGGVVVAVMNLEKSRRAAVLCILGLVVIVLQRIGSIVLYRVVLQSYYSPVLYSVIGFAQSVGTALAVGLLVAAAFVDRTAPVQLE